MGFDVVGEPSWVGARIPMEVGGRQRHSWHAGSRDSSLANEGVVGVKIGLGAILTKGCMSVSWSASEGCVGCDPAVLGGAHASTLLCAIGTRNWTNRKQSSSRSAAAVRRARKKGPRKRYTAVQTGWASPSTPTRARPSAVREPRLPTLRFALQAAEVCASMGDTNREGALCCVRRRRGLQHPPSPGVSGVFHLEQATGRAPTQFELDRNSYGSFAEGWEPSRASRA